MNELDFEMEKEESNTNTEHVDEVQAPEMGSKEWSDYVISLLYEEEIQDGAPKVDGLRRVAQVLLGPICDSVTRTVKAPNPANNDWCSTVEHNVTFLWMRRDVLYGREVRFSGVADCNQKNTPAKFLAHSSSTAESKAESKALRKALRLKNIISAEEKMEGEVETPSKINATQLKAMEVVSEKANIDVGKLISTLFKGRKVDDLVSEEATQVMKQLSEYNQNRDGIPEEFRGYSKNWRNN